MFFAVYVRARVCSVHVALHAPKDVRVFSSSLSR